MFEKNDKRRLYWLMDQYLSEAIDADSFCDEFYYCFDLELNSLNLTPSEEDIFGKLSEITGRFSRSESEHQECPGAYFTEEELKQKVIETKNLLKSIEPLDMY